MYDTKLVSWTPSLKYEIAMKLNHSRWAQLFFTAADQEIVGFFKVSN